MEKIWSKIQLSWTVLGGWLGSFVGGADGLLTALLVFVAMDYATGVLRAVSERKLSSAVGFKGICRKVLIFVLVGMANIIDERVTGAGGMLRAATICFYLSNEGVSILENAAGLGLPIPEKMKEVLQQLHSREEKDDQK